MENTCRFIGVMYCGDYARREDGEPDDYLYVGYNMHWNSHELALPSLPEKRVWRRTVDTGRRNPSWERLRKSWRERVLWLLPVPL